MATSAGDALEALSAAQRQQAREAVDKLLACGLTSYTVQELDRLLPKEGADQVLLQPSDIVPEPRQQELEGTHQSKSGSIMITGGMGSEEAALRLEVGSGTWEPIREPLGTPRRQHAGAVLGGLLYLVGGSNLTGKAVASAERFDPVIGRWSPLPSLKTPRWELVCVTAQGRLFAVGGFNGYQTFAVAESLEPEVDGAWAAEPPLRVARAGMGAASLGGRVYVMGGDSASAIGRAVVGDVECLEPRPAGPKHAWERLEGLRAPRRALAAASLAGRIYAAGGYDGNEVAPSCVVEVYDPTVGHWSVLPELPTPRCWLSVVGTAGELYVLGGMDDNGGYLPTVERYNPVAGTWARGPDLPSARSFSAAVALE